jgi:TonB-dependent SusC/RagA subfamily outer membrane receptor
MRSYFPPRTALSVCVLVGLAAACTTSNARLDPAARPTATAADMERNPGEPIEKTLQAKDPSLQVSRTSDGGISLQIRGASSFSANTAPLFVVNGSPFEPGPLGSLIGVNPYDIETIKVLKNPADIGVYGMRGANGVIVITTRRPGKQDD